MIVKYVTGKHPTLCNLVLETKIGPITVEYNDVRDLWTWHHGSINGTIFYTAKDDERTATVKHFFKWYKNYVVKRSSLRSNSRELSSVLGKMNEFEESQKEQAHATIYSSAKEPRWPLQ